jgi:hypothetical protein
MKHEIEIPEGFEFDKENSVIKFKEIKKQLPKSWEDLKEISGAYISIDCNILNDKNDFNTTHPNKNIFKTKEQAEASIALVQLSQLRDVYRQGWTPDWSDNETKHCIRFFEDNVVINRFEITHHFLSFQSNEIAQEFLDNFKDLIIKAKPLMS